VSKLNQSDFAKEINKTRGYVTQLKQAGRLVFADDGLVDVEASIQRIADTADANRDDVVQRHAEKRGEDANVAPTAGNNHSVGTNTPTQQEKAGMSLQAARAVKENYQARMAKLEYEKAIGAVINADDAKMWAADIGATFSSGLESLSGRLSSELAMKDSAFIRAHLVEVFKDLLNNVSDKIMNGIKDAS
jgi:hypothetical protein